MIRYAILYFFLLIVFVALMVGPVVAGKFLKLNITIPLDLLQPTNQDKNDTTASTTGRCLNNLPCPGPGGDDTAPTTTGDAKMRRFVAY